MIIEDKVPTFWISGISEEELAEGHFLLGAPKLFMTPNSGAQCVFAAPSDPGKHAKGRQGKTDQLQILSAMLLGGSIGTV